MNVIGVASRLIEVLQIVHVDFPGGPSPLPVELLRIVVQLLPVDHSSIPSEPRNCSP